MNKKRLKKKSDPKNRSFLQIFLGITILTISFLFFFRRNFKTDQVSWAQDNSALTQGKNTSVEENQADVFEGIQKLQESLKRKEEEISQKSRLIDQKVERLNIVKQDILQQIEAFQSLRQEIERKLQQLEDQKEVSIKKLSKIFEGTPPEEASAIIAKTDVPTAAEIILRMEKRKAGKMWGFIDPKLAAKITSFIMEKNTLASNKELADQINQAR